MEEIRLKVQKRAIPGRGRVRINTATLASIDAREGGGLDLFTADRARHVTATAFADTIVDAGAIRVSPEDLKSLGIQEGDAVIVKKAPPVAEQVKRTAKETAGSVEKELRAAGKTIKGKAEKATQGAAKTAKQVSKDLGEAGKSIKGKAEKATQDATKTAGQVSRELGKAGKSIAGEAKKVKKDLLKKREKDL
jgi:hypothetical protein